MENEQPDFYFIVPEFNSQGRLCNYHGDVLNDTIPVKVPAAEFERFNQLAGRQHEIVDGIVVFNETLTPCLPDEAVQYELQDVETRILAILDQQRIDEVCGVYGKTKVTTMLIDENTPYGLPAVSELDSLVARRNELKSLIEGD